MLEHDDRDLFHPKLAGSQQASVTGDDVVVSPNQDRVRPTPFADRSRYVGNLFAAMRPRVGGPWNQLVDRPSFDLNVDVCRALAIGGWLHSSSIAIASFSRQQSDLARCFLVGMRKMQKTAVLCRQCGFCTFRLRSLMKRDEN
jgi:hypothetical protein